MCYIENYSATILSIFSFLLDIRQSMILINLNSFILQEFIFVSRFNQIFKAFCQANIIFCRALIITNAILFCKMFPLLLAYLSLFDVNFVAHKNSWNVWICILFYRLNPIRYVFKRLFICNIKGYYNSICFFVKWISYCDEPFLTCGVPYFDRNLFIFTFYCIFYWSII